MKILGVHVAKSQFRYAVLEGTKEAPVLVAKDKQTTVDPNDVPALMDWYDTQIAGILDAHSPDKIAYRLTLDPKKIQIFTSEFPLGILNLHAHKQGIPIREYVSGNYVASRLGLPKDTDLYVHCDEVIGEHPPYWDTNQKYAVLAAWFELP